jgi:integrase
MPTFDKRFKKYHANGVIRRTTSGKYVGEFNRDQRRRRMTFETQDQAHDWLDSFGAARDRAGEIVTRLSGAQLQDALQAIDHLMLHGHKDVSLFAVAEHYTTGAAIRDQQAQVGTIGDWFNRYLEHLRHPQDGGDPARPRTIENKNIYLRSFLKAYEAFDAAEVTSEDVELWLKERNATGRHLLNFKTEIQSLFNFVSKNNEGYQNTVAKFPQRKKKQVDPASILTPKQAEKLLRALENKSPSAALAVALGCFAGIRTAEITEGTGLQWNHIDFDAREIHIPAELAKDREAREIPINDTMAAWLQRYRFEDNGTERRGRIAPGKWYLFELRREAAQAAKVSLTGNQARHSFGTYYGRLHGYRNASEIMGHSGDMKVFNAHYKGRATEKTAREYFDIMPLQGAAKVIKMEAIA